MTPVTRQNFSSHSFWESRVGYSRAVRLGNVVEVAGTIATNDVGEIVGEEDAYKQTTFIFAKIEKVLREAGVSLQDVVRTRMFVTDISLWEEIGKAHALYFRDIRPAATLVEVNALIDPKALVEIEVTAILSNHH